MVDTNYFGMRRLCEVLFPLLRRGARIVNVSSSMGRWYMLPKGSSLLPRLKSKRLTLEELDG